MREFHEAVAGFVPPPDAVWREGGHWSEGLIIGHNDAAPYNAAWRAGRLTGFFDWDYAGPVTREWDLAFAAFSWVPLHARHVVAPQGFTAFETRAERLRRFLGAYGWDGSAAELLNVVKAWISAHADGIRRLAAAGEAAFVRFRDQGVPVDLERALAELDALRF
ncbi:phosphotransferase [Actinomadura nitritigenes]|uniref:phosphotransferase n=1 Tax=Actinomadura nitritigenes TaxID=134602 RepID=UPI003D94F363